MRQVEQHVSSVTAREHNLIMENEIAAHERSVARADASGEALVVRVAQANDGASGASLAEVNLEKAKVPLTEAGHGVQLLLNRELAVVHLLAED